MCIKVRPSFFSGLLHKITLAIIFSILCFQLLAQQYPTIKAKKGDGVYSVLKKNGYPPAEYKSQFLELNKPKLSKNNELVSGRIYRLPLRKDKNSPKAGKAETDDQIQTKKVYEIYGPKYREVIRKSNVLSGTVFYLMSGHGGPDPGAIGKLNGHMLCEDEYAYDVTLRLARNLTECGASVYMIIRDLNDGIRDEAFLKSDKDEVCYPREQIPLSQLGRLRQETVAVNKLRLQNKGKFQRMLVIHVDSRSTRENIDVFFYHDAASSLGRKLALALKNTFMQKYAAHQPGRGYEGSVSDRNLYVIKNAKVPAVFIELGNINHTRDQQRFIIPDNRQAVANWLRDGLIEDYKKGIK